MRKLWIHIIAFIRQRRICLWHRSPAATREYRFRLARGEVAIKGLLLIFIIGFVIAFNYGGCGVNDAVVGSSSGLSTPVPFLATNPATNITQTSATLNGIINPNGVILTTIYFNYGLTPSYTVTTASRSIGNCYSAEAWDTISGLSPNTLLF